MYLKIIYFLLYFTLHLTAYSQVTDQLILEKLGRKKRITYQIGDGIILKLINIGSKLPPNLTIVVKF